MSLSEELLAKYPSLKSWGEGDKSDRGGGREQALLRYVKSHPNLPAIQGHPEKILATIDEFAANEVFLMNIGIDKARILSDLLADEKPQVLVELGGYVGYSAIFFADQMSRLSGSRSNIKVWSLEYEQEYADIANELVSIAGLSEIVTIVVGTAEDSLRTMTARRQLDHIDLLFLDHVEDLYKQDFQVCETLGLLKSGACIVADNVVIPGAPEYRGHVRAHPGLKSWGVSGLIIPGDLEDELEVSKVV